jgi:threonine aldolase
VSSRRGGADEQGTEAVPAGAAGAPLTLFASDNYAGAHPAALEAVAAANTGWARAYGDDEWTARLGDRLREVFGDCEAYPVFNGTGGNVTALAAVLRPFEAVICPETAHINVDECGAPERIAGVKLVDVPTPDGKLTPELLGSRLVGLGDQHHVQVRMVSISQSTELGTVYTPEEMTALAAVAHDAGLLLHVDGARLFNAAEALDVGLRELTTDCGVDVLTLGGTKSGLLGAEAVVFLRPELAADYLYARKQGTQLASKMRFVSAQLLCLFEHDLWRQTAGHANAMARRLRDAVADVPGVRLAYPVEANAVFVALPAATIPRLHERYHFYVWDDDEGIVRLMCSWQTTPADVDALAAAILAAASPVRPVAR